MSPALAAIVERLCKGGPPSAEDIRIYLEHHPDVALEVMRTVRIAGPWDFAWRYVYAGASGARQPIAWAEPAWQSPQDIAERKPRRWSWGVEVPGRAGQGCIAAHGECDTQEEARAAADAVLREQGYGLANEVRS